VSCGFFFSFFDPIQIAFSYRRVQEQTQEFNIDSDDELFDWG
jgi:hypothetical protein